MTSARIALLERVRRALSVTAGIRRRASYATALGTAVVVAGCAIDSRELSATHDAATDDATGPGATVDVATGDAGGPFAKGDATAGNAASATSTRDAAAAIYATEASIPSDAPRDGAAVPLDARPPVLEASIVGDAGVLDARIEAMVPNTVDAETPCSTPSDCPPTGNDCVLAVCAQRQCGTAYASATTVLALDSTCEELSCDGQGRVRSRALLGGTACRRGASLDAGAGVCNGAGVCGDCVTNATDCSAGEVPRSCGANGQWILRAPCGAATPFCVQPASQASGCAVCRPTTSRCSAKSVQVCDAAGTWVTKETCPGACVAVGAPGSYTFVCGADPDASLDARSD